MKSILLLIILSFSTTTFSQTKIGVINKQQLLDSLPSRQFLLQEVEQLKVDASKELGVMDSTLNVFVLDYQKDTAKSALIKQYLEVRIVTFQSRIKAREEEIDFELKQIEANSIEKSESVIKQATKNVSTKLALDVVLDSSQTIYFKEKIDITNQVLTEMLKIDKSTQ